MKPTKVFKTYWTFAAERQRVYYRRLKKPSGPWSDDPILNEYRFTNCFRASDRVSQYLIREVQYRGGATWGPNDLLARTILFKIFNKIDTWETIEAQVGTVNAATLSTDRIDRVLNAAMKGGQKVYSAAYIMASPKFGFERKHANHLALVRAMLADRLPERIRQRPNLGEVYRTLRSYSGLGSFLAFQFAIDLNYSDLCDFGEDSFVVAGPGALDGISKCFSQTGGRTAEEIIMHVYENQEMYCERYDLPCPSLFGRRLMPIDCQNLFCEISKYARVAHPDVPGVSGRKRIKQTYKPAHRAVPRPFFPPKWQLAPSVDAFFKDEQQSGRKIRAA